MYEYMSVDKGKVGYDGAVRFTIRQYGYNCPYFEGHRENMSTEVRIYEEITKCYVDGLKELKWEEYKQLWKTHPSAVYCMIELKYKDVDVHTGAIIKAGYVVYTRERFQKIHWFFGILKRTNINIKENISRKFVFGAEQEELERVKLLLQKQYAGYDFDIEYTPAVNRIKYDKQNKKITLEVKYCGLYKLSCKTKKGVRKHDNLTYAKVKEYLTTFVGASILSEVLSFFEQEISQHGHIFTA